MKNYIIDYLDKIPRVKTKLEFGDKLGHIAVRFGIKRYNYTVDPGVYAVGSPDKTSKVFVSANYKLSFDILRKNLDGLNAWILVLDTKGINVWCAAGKGTFGTMELVKRIDAAKLEKIIEHRQVIVPQLGAVGVSAHMVKMFSGFSVAYGPVYAKDIKEYLDLNMRATGDMRKIKFTIIDRLVLTPMEVVVGMKYILPIIIAVFLASGITSSGFSLARAFSIGYYPVSYLAITYLTGTVLGPLLLPWLPARSFALKGCYTGVLIFVMMFLMGMVRNSAVIWFLIVTSISSFLTMNFTGSSTYTSLSGVIKEMKIAIPLQIAGVLVALGIMVVKVFL